MAATDFQIPDVAIYDMPAYAASKIKRCPRIFPKNGSEAYRPNDTILFELPAQGYLNPQGTTISFDLYIKPYDTITAVARNPYHVRPQSFIGSVFKSIKLKYGSSYLEALEDVGYLSRQLAEVEEPLGAQSATYLNNGGTGQILIGTSFNRDTLQATHGIWKTGSELAVFRPCKITVNGIAYAVRRYQIHLPLGLLKQKNLIPLAFMASQFAIEVRLAKTEEFILASPSTQNSSPVTNTGTPSYFIANVTLHPELLEFDSRFDDLFFKEGLSKGGVPLQFNTWNSYIYPVTSNNMTISIPEKSRSLKSILVFMRQQVADFPTDYGASFGDFNTAILNSFQFRIGNMYYPASPVINSLVAGYRTGSVEPLQEFLKVLKRADDQLPRVDCGRWNFPSCVYSQGIDPGVTANVGFPTIFGAADYKVGYNYPFAVADSGLIDRNWVINSSGSAEMSGIGSSYFCFAIDLESSNGAEISGLNVEEQSDITLSVKWDGTMPTGLLELVAYCNVDQAILIKDNNRVEHII